MRAWIRRASDWQQYTWLENDLFILRGVRCENKEECNEMNRQVLIGNGKWMVDIINWPRWDRWVLISHLMFLSHRSNIVTHDPLFPLLMIGNGPSLCLHFCNNLPPFVSPPILFEPSCIGFLLVLFPSRSLPVSVLYSFSYGLATKLDLWLYFPPSWTISTADCSTWSATLGIIVK